LRCMEKGLPKAVFIFVPERNLPPDRGQMKEHGALIPEKGQRPTGAPLKAANQIGGPAPYFPGIKGQPAGSSSQGGAGKNVPPPGRRGKTKFSRAKKETPAASPGRPRKIAGVATRNFRPIRQGGGTVIAMYTSDASEKRPGGRQKRKKTRIRWHEPVTPTGEEALAKGRIPFKLCP